jgi:NAD dependent epimerase/dehydratase
MAEKKLANTKVLVTGAGGFIGSHLCEMCLAEGAEVRAFVHYNSRTDLGMLEDVVPRRRSRIEIVAGDLRDPDAVRRAVGGCEIVFHLGALIGVPYSYSNPADVVATNVLGSLHVLQAARETGVLRLVQTSTSEVYGTARQVPMTEDHPFHPQSPYAASKIAGDMLALSFHRTYSLPVTVLRPFNTYGPRQSPRAIIPAIIIQALTSDAIRLGSLSPRRDLTFVTDTARGFIAAALARKAIGEVVQLGTQKETSVGELVEMIGRALKRPLHVLQDRERIRPADSEVERLLASNSRAANILGWRPKISLEEGLGKTVNWFRNKPDGYKRRLYHI